MTLAALVEKGDEVLFPGPTYPPYISYARFFERRSSLLRNYRGRRLAT